MKTMKSFLQHWLFSCSAALVAVVWMPQMALSLTWDAPNVPDENTIALLHFDEGEGYESANAGDPTNPIEVYANPDVATEAGDWSLNPSWMRFPSGAALCSRPERVVQSRNAARAKKMVTLDWSKDVTISYWCRITDPVQGEAYPFIIQTGTWQNPQFQIGFRHGYSNAMRFMAASIDIKNCIMPHDTYKNVVQDGQWHHIAMVYTFDADTQIGKVSLYLDNEPVELFGNAGQYEYEITDAGALRGPQTSQLQLLYGYNGEVDEVLIQQSAIRDFSNGYKAKPYFPATVISVR